MQIFSRIKEKFQNAENKFINSQYLVFIVPILVFLLAFLLYAPYLFNNNNLRFQLEQKISQYTKGNLEIKGEVKVQLLPSPALLVQDSILKNYIIGSQNYNFHIKNTEIKLSFLASLIGRFSIKEIDFSNILIEKHNSENPLEIKSKELSRLNKTIEDKRNQSGIGGNLFSVKNLDLNRFKIQNLPRINISNLRIISYSKLGNKREITNFNGNFSFSEKLISGHGNFLNQNIKNDFNISLKPHSKDNDSTINLTSSFGNLKIYGSFFDEKENKKHEFANFFKGTIESEIFDIKDFYKSFVSSDGYIFEQINKSQESIKLKAGILKEKSEIKITNIFLSSNLLNGRGNVNIDFSNKIPLVDVSLYMENIDLDSILTNEKKSKKGKKNLNKAKKKKEGTKSLREAGLDLSKDFRDVDLTLEARISRVRYLAEEIRNIDLYTTISRQGEILILPLQLEVPGGGKFRINGVIEKRDNSPKFVGKIDASGKNLADLMRWLNIESQNLKYNNLKEYKIYSDLMLMPSTTTLNNFYLNFNNQNTELLGEMRIDYYNKSSNIISIFEVHNLDIDDYFLTSGQNIYLSAGDLLKKTLWLNNLTSQNDLTLNFDKLRYKNITFKNQALKARFGNGYIEIDKLDLDSEDFNIELSLAIDITEAQPKFDMSVKSSNFNYKSPNKAIISDRERGFAPPNKNAKKLSWIDQFFALPSFENFNGSVKIDLEKANLDGLKLENLKIDSSLRSGVFDFSKFEGEFYGGKFTFNGSTKIAFEKSINGNATITKTRLLPLLFHATRMKKIDGLANISSSISSNGTEKKSFLENLNLDAKFKSANIKIAQYGLNDLIKKMFNPFYFQAQLEDPLAILQNKNSTTEIKKAEGVISIKKGKENRFKSNFSGTAFNGITSAQFDLQNDEISGSSNIIFLTGTKTKQIPINIANNFSGNFDNISHNTNMKQVLQYLKAVRKQINRGAKKLEFKETQKERQEKQAQEEQKKSAIQNINEQMKMVPRIKLSKEQMQMIEKSYPNGIPNMQKQLENQNYESYNSSRQIQQAQ